MTPAIFDKESALLQSLQAHDEQAFSFLYDRYSRALLGVVQQIVHRQDLAKDVLQEVFVKIWQHIDAYDPSKGRLYTWMLNIARHAAIDRTRSKDFNRQAKTIELSDNVYNQQEVADSRIEDVGLKKTLDNLPTESRKLLELSYFLGYTQEEISKLLHMPLGTVKTRIRAALLQLRKIVGK